ncbi:MAG: hypothetical protein R3C41_12075 [Calditrichia bacterium]
MDIFKIGLRDILGLTLPGFIFVIALTYCIYEIALLFNVVHYVFILDKDQQFLIFSIAFALSYVFGGVFRLWSADDLDGKSSKKLLKRYEHEHELNEIDMDDIKAGFDQGQFEYNFQNDVESLFDDWIWREEKFPYHIWEFRKFEKQHPKEMFNFYCQYKDQMLNLGHLQKGKEFFNYCKMVIINSGDQTSISLKEEVSHAETTVRFFAGTYFAIFYSLWLLGILGVIQFITIFFNMEKYVTISKTHYFGFGLTLLFIIIAFFINISIKSNFRRLRLKEVDTVYDAFYLVHRHPESCENCSKGLSTGTQKK